MKAFVVFIVLGSLTSCLGDHGSMIAGLIDDLISGGNDDSINRPCPNLDVACIRPILTSRLRCSPLRDMKSGKYSYDNIPLFFSHADAVLVWNNATITGFDDFEIEEFYINEISNTLVMETILNLVHVESLESCVYYLMKGKQPVQKCGKVAITYKKVSLTMTMYDQDQSGEIYVFPELGVIPILAFDPSFTPTDLKALESFLLLVANLPLTFKEAFISQGPIFVNRLLRTAFCDEFSQEIRY